MVKQIFKTKDFKLAVIGILVCLCISFIGFPSNSQQYDRWVHLSCPGLVYNPQVRAECEFLFNSDTNYAGNRELLISTIEGNGGNVFVRVYDAESLRTILEANPGVGGRETFYFDAEKQKQGYKIFVRLHNLGSSVRFSVGRTR